MIVYLDENFNIYTTYAENRFAVETNIFDGMPSQIIECYIFVPEGYNYTKPNGITVYGEFIQPFVSMKELDYRYRNYEKQLLEEQAAIIEELDAALLDAQYQNLIGEDN